MSSNSINQGAAGGIIIQPTWGTIEGSGSSGKEDNFDAILNELRTYLDAKADKKDVYTKDETDELLDDRLDITPWKTSANLSYIIPGTSDATHTDNNVSSALWTSAMTINDSQDHLLTRYETEVNPNGNISSIWYIRNYDTTGNIKGSKGLRMTMDKSGALSWTVHDPDNFRSAISAASASHTHNNIVSRGSVTAETGANRPAVEGLSMTQAYSNGYPTTYGNVISLKGLGDGEILVGWSGTSGDRASTYLRSRRDTEGANWSDWFEVLDSGNYSTYAAPASHTHSYLPLSGGTLTGDLFFGNSGTSTRQLRFQVGDNDYGRIASGATAANAGWMEIATADDANEPIYVRQYSGAYATISRTLTLLDASGNTSLPGTLKFAVGAKNAIGYQGTQAYYDLIRFIDNTVDTYGNGISIGGGGLTIIGGGESALNSQEAFSSGGDERLILCNDGAIDIWTNCQNGQATATKRQIDTNGNFTGNAANVTGTVAIGNGGTGATTAQGARNNFLGPVTNPINSKANDTTANWGNYGPCVAWYNTAGLLNDQISQWGFLLNFRNGADVFQIWNQQSGGVTAVRSGNGSGWNGSWRMLYKYGQNVTISTTALTDGTSALATGYLYFQY